MRALSGLLGTLVLFLGGCAPVFQRPSVEVMAVSVGSLGLTGATAEVELRVGNPNRVQLRILEVEYDLEVGEPDAGEGWERLADGVSVKEVILPPKDTVPVALEVPFRYGGLGAAVRSLLRSGEVGYHLRGRLRARGSLGEIVRPFEARGVVRP